MKKADKFYRANKLFHASKDGDVKLMREMKKIRTGTGNSEDLTGRVDEATGVEGVTSKFKEVYEHLYNCSDSKPEMSCLKNKIHELIPMQQSVD